MFYFISVLISILVTNGCDVALRNKVKDMGYIYKGKKHSKISSIVSLSKYFIPYLNIISTSIEALLSIYLMKHEELIVKFGSLITPETAVQIYKRYPIDEQKIKDMLILDGANEEVISEEIKNVKKEQNETTYSEYDYNLACSIIAANQQIFEIECNTTLTNDEKQKLLRMYRNAYLKELNGNKKEDLKPIVKTLELVKSK